MPASRKEKDSTNHLEHRSINHPAGPKYLKDLALSIRAAHGLEPGRYNFFYVDLQMVDEGMAPEQLWRRLLVLMRRQCTADDIADILGALERSERLTTFDLDELFQEVDDAGLHIVFLLDEFERVTENTNFGPDFYYGLRSLIIRHKVALVTSSRLEPTALKFSKLLVLVSGFPVMVTIWLRVDRGVVTARGGP